MQRHDATRLHYDFRLELDGVLLSWAVPKGPNLDPATKRLAVHVEDHPIEYGSFEGEIPKGEYGAGTVVIWDRGTWQPIGNPRIGYRDGKLKFTLKGRRLRGRWTLVRIRNSSADEKKENWLLIKEHDSEARTGKEGEIVRDPPASIANRAHSRQRSVPIAGSKGKRGAPTQRARATSRSTARAENRSEKIKRTRTVMPQFVAPELPTLVDKPPAGDDWIHEIKLDGYRALCRVDRGSARILTRNAKDWTKRFGALAAAAEALPVQQALLDGEVVALTNTGTTNFQALQSALAENATDNLVYFAFDLLHLDGRDLRPMPLTDRKEILSTMLPASRSSRGKHRASAGNLRYTSHVTGSATDVYREACKLSLEGIVCKRPDAAYHSGRSRDWLKVKCLARQEFVVVGYTDPSGTRAGFGALLLAVNARGGLTYSGRVGTGFDAASLRDLLRRLRPLERTEAAVENAPRGASARGVHWVEPRLVAEVGFSGWTRDGMARHPTFHGLREDKKPADVARERPARVASVAAASKRAPRTRTPLTPRPRPRRASHFSSGRTTEETTVAGVRLTNPTRVLYPQLGITKLGLAEYYESIADWILPHIASRPLSIVRCPEGVGAECFYQKHASAGTPREVRAMRTARSKSEAPYLCIEDLPGLIALVQLGALEIHPWGCRARQVERPDRLVFDLDPSPELAWSEIIDAARRVRRRLLDLGLTTFVKTTGGKGLHVVAPLTGRHSWVVVKSFSKGVAIEMAREWPECFTATMSKRARVGRIFIDAFRNARGATAVAAYSTRARAGATVSTPIAWEELSARGTPGRYSIQTVRRRLGTLKANPWDGFMETHQVITRAMQREVGL